MVYNGEFHAKAGDKIDLRSGIRCLVLGFVPGIDPQYKIQDGSKVRYVSASDALLSVYPKNQW